MIASLQRWVFGRVHEREAQDRAEREVIRAQVHAGQAIDQYARQVADRGEAVAAKGLKVAVPTGMLIRDITTGNYDPDSPIYGGRGK